MLSAKIACFLQQSSKVLDVANVERQSKQNYHTNSKEYRRDSLMKVVNDVFVNLNQV